MKYVAYGPWFTYNACPQCERPVSSEDIYDRRCCPDCGRSGTVMLDYAVMTARRAYTKKTWVPFMSKYEIEIKGRKDRFSGGGYSLGMSSHLSTIGMSNLTTAAAVAAIF
ncbi:hypothetical protein PMW_13 [Pseudomonas phage phiPMW]|uniref:Uncharacterized protein n=1 Tax=Pseudomonas phage phiPMW TaxID=1815582 RepID=A0A1S5R177_9CAUD|nr:hypothetical protein FDG97_gp013 [Pseudomonas phage phiPMW]ANA49138.1 hypothetical protein PMW_13 [Pseudomonas phage phiPMW]